MDYKKLQREMFDDAKGVGTRETMHDSKYFLTRVKSALQDFYAVCR